MAEYGSLPFTEAIDFVRDKIPIPTKTWSDITNAMHGRAFVIAGANNTEIVSDFHESIIKAIESGTDITAFRKDFDAIVKKHGWSYNGKRGWRSSIMLDTNLSTAYSAGREKQRRTPAVVKAFPNNTYRTMDDGRVRPFHRSWNNVTLPHDDPWWNTHLPPNGWRCRCWTEPSAGTPDDSAPSDGTVAWKNPATGKTEMIPAGIDPGFAYNPADASWGKFTNDKLAGMSNRPYTPVNPLSHGDYKRQNIIPIDKSIAWYVTPPPESYFTAPDASVMYTCESLKADPDYIPYLKDTIEKPYEIWMQFLQDNETGRVIGKTSFVKSVKITGKTANLILTAINNMAISLSAVDAGDLNSFRSGRLIYGRGK